MGIVCWLFGHKRDDFVGEHVNIEYAETKDVCVNGIKTGETVQCVITFRPCVRCGVVYYTKRVIEHFKREE
jgi:hypothetical protein